MEVRIRAKLNQEQKNRLIELKKHFGTDCNAKIFKRLLEAKLLI